MLVVVKRGYHILSHLKNEPNCGPWERSMAWAILHSNVSNLLKLIQASNDSLRFLTQIELHITNPKLPPLLHTLVSFTSCFLDDAIDVQLRCSFVDLKRFPFLGVQASQSPIPESICHPAWGDGSALRLLGRTLGLVGWFLHRIMFLYLNLIWIWRGNVLGGHLGRGRWVADRWRQSPRLLHCAQVSKLVERRVRGCDVGVDLGSYLVLPYQMVAVMHFAVEARALKVLRISFF